MEENENIKNNEIEEKEISTENIEEKKKEPQVYKNEDPEIVRMKE